MGTNGEEGFNVVDFEERGHLEFGGEDEKVDEAMNFEALSDEKNGIGTGGTCFVDLIFVDDEIFAKYGEVYRGSDLLNIGKVALEIGLVGET